ncbi:AzlD domain-containing protein [Enterovibrio paralichthyis]|uniref:AzlD domain-containing protein n=1 Tax=Enterovibrio paralichthyis TaxID=2853805 RepID=UPI001C444127|nr:AzlD domain-containing protein [Enterovibrio paralichthyis]MBV7297309.1 AzlD domain-containing protein [Enterovibrio paralichthyis]
MNTWILILGMAAITFSVRYFFLAKSVPFRVTPVMQRVLKYSTPAVLTALTVPILVFPTGEMMLDIDNPFLIAGIFACVLSLLCLHTLLTVIASMLFFLWIR